MFRRGARNLLPIYKKNQKSVKRAVKSRLRGANRVLDTNVTPAKQVQAESTSLCSASRSQRKKRDLKGVNLDLGGGGGGMRGKLPGVQAVCETPEAQEMALRKGNGLREDVTDGLGGEAVTARPPPSRPRAPVTHMRGPRPLGLPPPWGQRPPGEEDMRTIPASGHATRKQLPRHPEAARPREAPSSRPALPSETEPVTLPSARANSRDIWRAMAPAPPGVNLILCLAGRTLKCKVNSSFLMPNNIYLIPTKLRFMERLICSRLHKGCCGHSLNPGSLFCPVFSAKILNAFF
uniref:Uncharacterized protein n=1 Tax=Mustela putorius furo TaxID=9669 RepID=M3YRU5_MUSPF